MKNQYEAKTTLLAYYILSTVIFPALHVTRFLVSLGKSKNKKKLACQ